MKPILLILILLTTQTFARDIFERDLDHLDRIAIGSDMQAEGSYTVQYPGLGGQGGFQNPDCLVLNMGRAYASAEQIERLKKQIIVTDGDGVLFPNGHHRRVNVLKPKKIILGGGRGRQAMAFYLKDLGTYVTGVAVKAWSPYLSITQILEKEFGERAKEIELIFLRGCQL